MSTALLTTNQLQYKYTHIHHHCAEGYIGKILVIVETLMIDSAVFKYLTSGTIKVKMSHCISGTCYLSVGTVVT